MVSLAGNQAPGQTYSLAHAEDFDDGSHDNCGPVWFKAVRMNIGECNELNGDDAPTIQGYQEWPDDDVKFCCDDISNSPIMVRFLVFDIDPGPGPVNPSLMAPGRPLFGHFTECMVEVVVQDKQSPTVVAPPDIVVSCDFWFDINSIDDPNDPTFGRVVTDLSLRTKVKTNDIVCPQWGQPNFKYGYVPFPLAEDYAALYDPIHPENSMT